MLFCLTAGAGGVETPYREMRALWDMSGFRLEELSRAEKPWILVRVTPDADSGLTSGMHINVETGQLVREPGKKVEVVIKGTLQQVARFDGQVPQPTPEAYSWGVPHSVKTRDTRRLLFSPFVSGGMIVSQHLGGASGEKQFDPYFVIQDEWVGMLQSYQKLRSAQGDLWMRMESGEDRQGLRRLLAGENPFVALGALRVLRVANPPKGDGLLKLSDLVGSVDVKNRALLITDFLRGVQSVPGAADEVKKLVAGAATLEQLRPLAVAARAVLDFGSPNAEDEAKKISQQLLDHCSEAIGKLPGDVRLKVEIQKIINPFQPA